MPPTRAMDFRSSLIRGSDIGRWASASAAASVSSSGVNDSDIRLVVPHPTIIAE